MNVYLDGEGNPICANCMHNCSICNQPITDFAMMYGIVPLNVHADSKARKCITKNASGVKSVMPQYLARCTQTRVKESIA
jgi:hypothetical protein